MLTTNHIVLGTVFTSLVLCFGLYVACRILLTVFFQFKSGKAAIAFYEILYNSEPKSVARNLFFSLAVVLFPTLVLICLSCFNVADFAKIGPFGSTISGIMGPFVAIVAVWLIFKAFVMQFENNRTIQRQSNISRFETNFFQLLNLQQKITDDLMLYIEVADKQQESTGHDSNSAFNYTLLRGREAIRWIYDQRIDEVKLKPYFVGKNHGVLLDNIRAKGFYYMTENDDLSFLDHYFQHLYCILRYVDDQDELLTEKERYHYVCLLSAQLSDYELGLLFYYCLLGFENHDFKYLAEKYALFSNIRDKVLCRPEVDKKYFGAKAFKFDCK